MSHSQKESLKISQLSYNREKGFLIELCVGAVAQTGGVATEAGGEGAAFPGKGRLVEN